GGGRVAGNRSRGRRLLCPPLSPVIESSAVTEAVAKGTATQAAPVAEEPGPAPTTLLPPLSPVMESSRPTEQLLRPPGVQAPPVSPMPEEPPLSPAAENY